MANRRMFAQAVVMSDNFLDMPASTRCFYFSLGVTADDDGFVANPRSIMRQCGSTVDDFRLLVEKKYVIPFESGVIVITHWRQNNRLRPDRYNETVFVTEKARLSLGGDNKYQLLESPEALGVPLGIPSGTPAVDAGKYSIGKDSIEYGNEAGKPPRTRFVPPSVDEVRAYCQERGNCIDPEAFVNYYEANGWMQGKGKRIKDWRAAVRTWERREQQVKKAVENEFADVV